MPDGGLLSKRACHDLRVIAERPAHELFGPNGRQVVEFLDSLGGLTGAQWVAARDADWAAAWDAARDDHGTGRDDHGTERKPRQPRPRPRPRGRTMTTARRKP